MKHFPLSETITLGTENADNTLSLKVLIVTKVVASLTGISQTNVEKVSTQTRIVVFPDFLLGNFPI
jgi:hypothetical protein